MMSRTMWLALFSAAQVVAVTLAWLWFAPVRDWPVVQQFYGHLGPGAFLVGLGAVAILERRGALALVRKEAWLAIAAGVAYVLADTFIMHPPWGVFDGAGKAEEEHVALMALVAALGLSALLLLRRQGEKFPPSIHFVVGVAMVSIVFLGHAQPTMAGTMGHSATVLLLAIAAAFRVLGNIVEYGVAVIVAGFVFFASQMGLAMYVTEAGNSAGAWIAVWSMAGFLSATGYMALAPGKADDR